MVERVKRAVKADPDRDKIMKLWRDFVIAFRADDWTGMRGLFQDYSEFQPGGGVMACQGGTEIAGFWKKAKTAGGISDIQILVRRKDIVIRPLELQIKTDRLYQFNKQAFIPGRIRLRRGGRWSSYYMSGVDLHWLICPWFLKTWVICGWRGLASERLKK
jgi:hypothetical protein